MTCYKLHIRRGVGLVLVFVCICELHVLHPKAVSRVKSEKLILLEDEYLHEIIAEQMP